MQSAGLEARSLLRGARQGTLAVADGGQPHAALITPATAPDGSVLMLLSELSEHTKLLRADPRCAVMVMGQAEGPNAQTAPRVTIMGQARLEPDPAMKRRWLAVHPYAGFYAGFGDFHLWRVPLEAGAFVGGFARAARLDALALAPDAGSVAALAAAEASILEHCNGEHASAMARIGQARGGAEGGWQLAAVDIDGCDLALREDIIRVAWSEPIRDPAGVRDELMRIVRG